MAQQQHAAEVHPDELCPPNKRYDLMDANKKVDLENVQCLSKSKILTNIIKNHLLRFSIAASSSVPWIYMAQFWHTLKEDASMGRNLLFSSSSNIFDLVSGFNKYHRLDDHLRDGSTRCIQNRPRSPTPKTDTSESSAPKQSTVIHFHLPERRSTHLTPPVPVPNVEKADEIILQETLQVSLAEHKSREEQEARENVELVNNHLASEEIEKLVEGSENVIDDSLPPKNDEPQIPDTRLDPRSDKESPEVERTNVEEVEVTNVVIPVNVNEEILRNQELTELQGRYTYLFEHLKERFLSRKSFDTLADHLQEVIVESLSTMVDTHITEQVKKAHVPELDDPHDDAHLEGENSAKRQKTSEYEAYVSGESSSRQVNEEERDDDEIPSEQVSQDIMEEVSLTIDEEKLKKMVDEMLRQRCTSGDEHQYHIDQMKNFLKSDIVWESRKEILVSLHPRKTTPLVQSCQRDPEAPALSLINQDLLYLKKGSSGPEKIVLSLHKFPAIIFNDDDIEERTSRWVNKCVKKFNPYARYGVEHWKNPHAKIFYIRKQKEPGKSKEEVYSNSKIIQVIKTYWELGHEHKFITEIVARRANECIMSITESDYKNLNKNDIEDMYLLIMNGKVPDYAETGLLWSLSVFIRRVEKHRMFSIIYKPVHGIIYKNSKREKRVMRHSEIHKFCDATQNRVLEGIKELHNDVKYGYVKRRTSPE
ncbi:hypothetical protein Tco_0357350 [Tanacetum coccineum]